MYVSIYVYTHTYIYIHVFIILNLAACCNACCFTPFITCTMCYN